MSNELVSSNAVHAAQAQPIDVLLQPLSDADTSSFVHVDGLLRDLGNLPGAWETQHTIPPSYAEATSTFPPQSSNDELDSLVQHAAHRAEKLADFRNGASKLLRRYNEVAPSRADVLLLRSRVEYDWTLFVDSRRFVSDSHQAVVEEARAICEATGHSTAKLDILLGQASQDHKRHEDLLKKTFEIETQLSNAEYSLSRKEHRMAKAALNLIEQLNQFDLPNPAASQPSTAPSVVLEKEIPALVQNYFERAGDVGLERERIMELEVDHREERAARMFQEDQEITLVLSQDEFEEAYNKKLTDAEAALQEAIRKSENAKQVCIDADLDPEQYRFTTRDADDGADRSISDAEEYQTHETGLPTVMPNDAAQYLSLPLDNLALDQLARDEEIPTISAAVQASAPPSILSQGLSTTQHRIAHAPLHDRITGWMDHVAVEGGSTQPRPLSRTKSSESYTYPLVLEQRGDGTVGVDRAASHSRRQQRRGLGQHRNGHAGPKNSSIRRSFPPTPHPEELNIPFLQPWEGTHQDALDEIRRLSQSGT